LEQARQAGLPGGRFVCGVRSVHSVEHR
jgi:hypothetical protein